MAITFKQKPPSVQPTAPQKTYSQISQEIFDATTEQLKKKVGGIKLIFGAKKKEEEDDMTDRQKEALAAVGLPVPSPKKLVIIKPSAKIAPAQVSPTKAKEGKGELPIGAEVVVAYDLFHWVATRRVGDTGVITRSWPPPPHITEDREDYHLYEVKLDSPRTIGGEHVLMRAWELEVTR